MKQLILILTICASFFCNTFAQQSYSDYKSKYRFDTPTRVYQRVAADYPNLDLPNIINTIYANPYCFNWILLKEAEKKSLGEYEKTLREICKRMSETTSPLN